MMRKTDPANVPAEGAEAREKDPTGLDTQPVPVEDAAAVASILDAVAEAGAADDEPLDDTLSLTLPFAPVASKAKAEVERISGMATQTGTLAWGSRSDVGLIREHNEDSFVVRFPLFAVADGMGGHAAGEVASTIAVSSLAACGPTTPDDEALAAAIEKANLDVIEGATNGLGLPGMGTTCTAVVIDGTTMAVGHVGDSRCYLLSNHKLARVTHDHSYVEELVAAGEITPEEMRVHPNRSIITRALGNDPKMKADHFCIEVATGDRVLLCSDGLSSMVTDDDIEEALNKAVSPQAAADRLVELACAEGGHDNVTCVVIDVRDDGSPSSELRNHVRSVRLGLVATVALLAVVFLATFGLAHNTWYLADDEGYVSLYRGIPGAPQVLGLNTLVESTDVKSSELNGAIEERLETRSITFSNESDARAVLDDYRAQVARKGA